jgi:hypothetical protein
MTNKIRKYGVGVGWQDGSHTIEYFSFKIAALVRYTALSADPDVQSLVVKNTKTHELIRFML